ncbi:MULTISPECIES: hypothetical protein [unclassified Pseudomonas]|uniref:hypothetical protein n=1 Tax=unclassified Pseudomonas TaxID=196821 RepID=UPI000BDCB4B8|nr:MULTISPECIES: hypothetical protein [unclassified Pseudomonas]PVZ19952.1 hypothetical protein F474_00543 [Pseudomonas sp. URIL14HWK12:I12]PVZ27018.1 hypothetical protein F470_00198 [Pseudomonas sp. URIL14HWK12:I10]PVZ37907.1 hypothetical protein F472_00543 [Pseudomonas sp. URIL14HWK12:I11]SNZ05190.1 hypothetical protein SAMN05660463_00861 [Pseudomonas sp. URIL14HWK12:I9]
MKDLTLYLDGTTPDKLSMKRLAEYLRELSSFYGSEAAVHFDSVQEGSAKLVCRVEDASYPVVLNQVREVAGGVGAKRPTRSYKKLSDLMLDDRVDGYLKADGAQIIQFPKGKLAEPPLRIVKSSTVQGRLYSVGGKDSTVPVRLEGADGETLHCETNMQIAERLAQLLFKPVRLSGDGEWERRPDGSWRLLKLVISSHQKLEDVGFKAAIAKLKAAGGVKWDDLPSPHSEILESRG